jgi:hypothetical protein
MPNYSARDMLLRMANGGSVGVATSALNNIVPTYGKNNATAADLLAAEQRILGEIAADPSSWDPAVAYNAILESGVTIEDALAAGVQQSTIDAIFTSGAPLPVTAFSTPSTVTSAYESAPYAGQDMQPFYTQAQNYVSGLMADGVIDEAERREAQTLATQGGYTFQDMLAAGVDPSILFNVPAAKEPDPPVIVDPERPVIFPQTQTEYVPPTVYQPIDFDPGIYAPGQEALDREFRDSAPQTEVTQDIFGTQQLTGFDYTPAAKLLSATGSGFSFTPPSVTSRPRSLMNTGTLNRYTQGRAAQDLRQLVGNQTIDGVTPEQRYESYAGLLGNTGSYGGGLSRSQLFALKRQQDSQQARAKQEDSTGTIADYLRLNEDVGIDYARAKAAGELPANTTPEAFALNHYNTYGRAEIAAGKRTPFTLAQAQGSGPKYTLPAIGQFGEGDEESRQSNFTTRGYNTELLARDLGTAGGARIVPVFAEGGPVKKPRGFEDGGPADSMTADELTAQLIAMDTQEAPVPAQESRPTDQVQTESRSILDNLNRAMSQVTQPVVAAVTDMTVGLGDLAQMGTKAVANKMGIETKPFIPVGENIKASVGADNVSPLNPIYMGTQILPAAKLQKALAAGPAAYRELMAYLAGEGGAQVAATQFPDSLAAQLAGAVSGDMSARGILDTLDGRNVRRMAGDEPPIDDGPLLEGEPEGTVLGISDQSESGKMLDDVDAAADLSPAKLRRDETQAIDKAVKNRSTRQKLKTEARRIKSNYLPENGWAPIQAVGVKKGKPAFKDIPYGFEKPPAGMEKEAWANSLSDNLVREVDGVVERARSGDQAAVNILRQANWYRTMRDQLRSEFGGIGDVFADVLGTTSAQTNVEQNFRNATEILRRYSRGDFDGELQAYENRIKQGLPVDGKALTALHNTGEFPLITSSSGKLFNTNSPSSMGALLGMFRSVKMGSAPKTPNFTGNLIGLTNEATIDVWAGRLLRRLSGQSRVPPVAEKAVTGKHLKDSNLENPRVGGEFGFGQDVFRSAADKINAAGGVKSVIPEMGNLGPDDLQAVAWFMEKELWTKNGWTTKAGEGGSLEYEMSLAGGADQVRIDSLRREINAGFKAPNKRKKETDAEYAERVAQARRVYDNRQELAEIELRGLESPLQRYTLGISGEIRGREGVPDKLMSNYEQAELAAELDDVLRNDQAVRGYGLANAYGLFAGEKERSLNAEIIVGEDFNPDALTRRVVEQGKFYDQDAVFISKSVDASAPNVRPGVELYFRKAVPLKTLEALTQRLRDKGIDGFTSITDMRFGDKVNRQSRPGDPETASLTGLRFQYVPEFDGSFDPSKADEIYARQADLYRDVIEEIGAEGNVSDARLTYYDTKIFFRDDYDDYLRGTAPAGNTEARGELLRGANDPQPNNGGSAREELSKLVSDGVGQAARAEKVAPVKKSRGGSVERVYNDNRTYK